MLCQDIKAIYFVTYCLIKFYFAAGSRFNILIDTSTDQSIIIHKKDSSKEKITVVIDGNNITVNGKPIDDFTSKDIDIIKQDNMPDDDDVDCLVIWRRCI